MVPIERVSGSNRELSSFPRGKDGSRGGSGKGRPAAARALDRECGRLIEMHREDLLAAKAERQVRAFAIGVTCYWCVYAVAAFLRDVGVLA